MPVTYDFAVVGGGASGMAAAVAAAECGDRVLLLERSSALGKKISASGNGRCNLMNTGNAVYYGDTSFSADVISFFPQKELMRFWKRMGIVLTEDASGRVYPFTLQSSTILDALKSKLKMIHTDIRLQSEVTHILREKESFLLSAADQTHFYARRILISCGGKASPKLGGTDSGYRLLSSFGHSITPLHPALCPLCTDTRSVSGLSGIRVRCGIRLVDNTGDCLYETRGEVLFTDYGISGICAMQCARFVVSDGFAAELDLTDGLFSSSGQVMAYLRGRREQFAELSPEYLLNGLLMPRLSFAVLKQAGVQTRGLKTGDLSDQVLLSVSERLRCYILKITGTRGLTDAQVTAGGADCNEFYPSNLESKFIPGLHAAGEVLNVDGDCGGFNLMFAFSSGILAGRNNRTVKEVSE